MPLYWSVTAYQENRHMRTSRDGCKKQHPLSCVASKICQELSNPTLQQRLGELQELQEQTPEKPYSIKHRLALANKYKVLGYPDLAAGDAYKALLLVDEVAEEGEYYDQVLEATIGDYQAQTGRSDSENEVIVSYAQDSWLREA